MKLNDDDYPLFSISHIEGRIYYGEYILHVPNSIVVYMSNMSNMIRCFKSAVGLNCQN